MQKFLGAAFAAALIAASTLPVAAATQRHHRHNAMREAYHPRASEPFRDSNDAIMAPYGYAAPQLPSYYHGGYSAPAGH
jgi:hypothetical protein